MRQNVALMVLSIAMLAILHPAPLVAQCQNDACGWTKIEPNGETLCARGTPYAYWIRPADPDHLLIFFEGGGGCWNSETCARGSSFFDDSVSGYDNPELQNGIFDLDNTENPFRNHSILYIPYCTGDVHMGSNTQTYTGSNDDNTVTIHHNGFVNASVALQWAYDNVPEPVSVFITGCSAGSVGSAMFAPYIMEHYADARIVQMGDSLAFVFHRPLDLQTDYHAHDNFASWIPALQQIEPGEFTMARYYSAVANAYPDATFSQYNTLHDSVQIRFYYAVGGQWENWERDLEASLNEIAASASNFRSYTAAGEVHCITPLARFYTVETDGIRFRDWVADLDAGVDRETVHCADCEP